MKDGEAEGLITFTPIGYVENDFDAPVMLETIAAAESRVVVAPEFAEGLTGLEPGQRVMIVFYFHLVQFYVLLQHPRGDRSRPKRGVFALHTPYRPNPIGVTVVDLLSVERNVLRVRGLDALNGTPVLDIKLESASQRIANR
jgi:tRNA-Thr(GGU) m(6)t(6)A37 methyltransferase TsaA